MANNRMYLQCKYCHKKDLCLAKYYPHLGWMIPDHTLSWRLNEFLEDHQLCAVEKAEGESYLDGNFYTLIYEYSCLDTDK